MAFRRRQIIEIESDEQDDYVPAEELFKGDAFKRIKILSERCHALKMQTDLTALKREKSKAELFKEIRKHHDGKSALFTLGDLRIGAIRVSRANVSKDAKDEIFLRVLRRSTNATHPPTDLAESILDYVSISVSKDQLTRAWEEGMISESEFKGFLEESEHDRLDITAPK